MFHGGRIAIVGMALLAFLTFADARGELQDVVLRVTLFALSDIVFTVGLVTWLSAKCERRRGS